MEKEQKRREQEKATLCKSNTPDLINSKPNLPLTNPPTTALEDKKKTQEKQKDGVTNYYLPSPIYIASYEEEDAPNLVDHLIARPTLKERRDTSKTGENKTTTDRRNLIEIRDKDDELESDWDSNYSNSYYKEYYRKF